LFSSIILAGGKARRLGRDKLQEDVGGKTIFSRVMDTLELLKGDIIVVTGCAQLPPTLSNSPGVRIVTDVFGDGGPLGGVYTGLAASDSFQNLVVAGDMPFLNLSLLRYMLDKAGAFGAIREAGLDVVIPRINGFIEPLHAVYSQHCLPYIKKEMESGRRNIRSFFPQVRVRYIETKEIESFDRHHLSFFNINTEDDLAKAREIAKNREEF
jgi:molybdopterin-guanine dinucleotide biosynthesis protein A